MFQDLDATIAALITAEFANNKTIAEPKPAISFATPDDQFPPTGVTLPAINFFLYDIQENMALRRGDWITERQDKEKRIIASRRQPPVYVNCAYLITAWSGLSQPEAAKDEHMLLGEVMKVLLRYKRLPVAMLQGELAGQEPPLRVQVVRESHLQSLGEFWQAMGGKPKPALNYTVTVAVDVSEPEELGRVVTEAKFTFEQGVA